MRRAFSMLAIVSDAIDTIDDLAAGGLLPKVEAVRSNIFAGDYRSVLSFRLYHEGEAYPRSKLEVEIARATWSRRADMRYSTLRSTYGEQAPRSEAWQYTESYDAYHSRSSAFATKALVNASLTADKRIDPNRWSSL